MPWPPTFDVGSPLADRPYGGEGESPEVQASEDIPEETAVGYSPDTGRYVPLPPSSYDAQFAAFPANDEGRLAPISSEGLRKMVVEAAESKIGMPFVWGGESDTDGGYDDSGLVYMAFDGAGIDMPRISFAQASRGQEVPLRDLNPGDLVFWDDDPSTPGTDHIALYAGDGQVIEAPQPGEVVTKRKLSADENAYGVKLNY